MIYLSSFVINNGREDQEICVRIKFRRENIYIYIGKCELEFSLIN